MNKETRRQISLAVIIPIIAATMIFLFVAGIFVGQNVGSEPAEDRFMEGVMAGVDYAALMVLHQGGRISDEDYEKLNKAIEAYIEDPSQSNRENWYNLYQRMLIEMTQH